MLKMKGQFENSLFNKYLFCRKVGYSFRFPLEQMTTMIYKKNPK